MKEKITKHSLFESIVLHILPGTLIGAFYFLVVPFVTKNGFPSVMALILAGAFVLIPLELGFLIFQKYLKEERLINGVVKYFKPIPLKQYFLWVPLIFVLSGIVFTALKFSSDFLLTLFNWMPEDSFLEMGLNKEFSKEKLIITYGCFFLFLVLLAPIVEELYFRGYLLPRMPSKLKGWTEMFHSGLFALYHVWTPWMFVTRFLGVLPLIYIVKRKENILLGIIIHCLMNSIDFIIGLIYILNY